MQLKDTFATKQEGITVAYHPTHHHGHANFWYVYKDIPQSQSVETVYGYVPYGNWISYLLIKFFKTFSKSYIIAAGLRW